MTPPQHYCVANHKMLRRAAAPRSQDLPSQTRGRSHPPRLDELRGEEAGLGVDVDEASQEASTLTVAVDVGARLPS